MKALAWHGKGKMRCDTVPDPKIEHPRDAIIKVTSCAICGSDLHIYDGVIPSMQHGDVLGHETMGEVVELGSETRNLKIGDRVVVPFTISCGECFFCTRGFYSGCERSNPNKEMAEKLWGHSPAGLFGYSHLLGGYAGGQAEYLRVPYADVGPITVPDGITDEQALFLSDIFPTGYMAADFCNIQPGDTIAKLALNRALTVTMIERLNGFAGSGFRVGDELSLPAGNATPLHAGLVSTARPCGASSPCASRIRRCARRRRRPASARDTT